jgi:hypothetical protein
LICPRFTFKGAADVDPDDAEAWWASEEPSVREVLDRKAAFTALAWGKQFGGDKQDLTIIVPFPLNRLRGGYDLAVEVLPEMKEAAINAIFVSHGRPAPYRSTFED